MEEKRIFDAEEDMEVPEKDWAHGPTCEPPEEEEHTSDNDENPEEDWLAKDRGAESEDENDEQQAEH